MREWADCSLDDNPTGVRVRQTKGGDLEKEATVVDCRGGWHGEMRCVVRVTKVVRCSDGNEGRS